MTITKQILLVEDIKKKKVDFDPQYGRNKFCDTHGVIFFVSTFYES